MELLALVELVVKLVVEETVNEVLVMLLACRARPKSTEGPHSTAQNCHTAQNYHKHGSSLAAHPLTPLLMPRTHITTSKTYLCRAKMGQDGPRPQTSKTSLQRSSTVLVDRGGSRNATRLTLRTSQDPWRSMIKATKAKHLDRNENNHGSTMIKPFSFPPANCFFPS